MTTSLQVQAAPLEDGLLVTVSGDVDYSCSNQLREHLMRHLEQRPRRLVIDLAGVAFMDSAGVATLVQALQVQSRHQGELVLCRLQDRVRGIFEIARLNLIFKIVADVDEAQRA